MDLQAIRQAVADALSVITTPSGSPIQTSANILPSPTLPTAWSFPAEMDYHLASANGVALLHLTVQAFVSTAVDSGGQQFLDELIQQTGANSVKAALETDTTLGGLVQNLIVKKCSGYKQYPVSTGVHRLGADWELDIYV